MATNQQNTAEPMEQDNGNNQQNVPPQLTVEEMMRALAERIATLENVVQNQHNTIEEQKVQLERRSREKGEILKPKRPEDFGGDTSKMSKFFAELDSYFGYFPETLEDDEDRVLFAANCLTDTAAEWFRPILADYNANKDDPKKMKPHTEDIFTSYAEFKSQIEKSFGTMNEEREAERELRFLRQKGPLSKHTTTFLRLLTKVNWTEETKKEVYYNSVKSEVKDELFKENRSKIGFIEYTQKAIDIDNRNFERTQERKFEKHGYGQNPKTITHANQGKKRDDYVAKDNGTRPGKMDIDDITKKKFTGTCNACGKKGHKEAYCRSKMTCGFCGKKGHDEAHCYTKKNTRKSETTKDKAQIDAITEVPHDHLSWTACYNDLCLMHKSSKEGSGYYPKKPRARKSHETVRIDTLNFYEKKCENCSSTEPCSVHALYECSSCGSWNINHTCENNESEEWELSDEEASKDEIVYDESGRIHECSFRTTDRKHQQWINTLPETHPSAKYKKTLDPEPVTFEDVYDSNDSDDDECHQCGALEPRHDITCPKYAGEYGCPLCMSEEEKHKCTGCVYCKSMKIPHLCDEEMRKWKKYQCKVCESTDLDHDCDGCRTCGSYDPEHDCMYVLGEQAEEQERQEEQQRYLDENPPRRISLEEARKQTRLLQINVKEAYDQVRIQDLLDALDEDCGAHNWKWCDNIYCQKHIFDKLDDWHIHRPKQVKYEKCTADHFLDCTIAYCSIHGKEKSQFYRITRKLAQKGYDFENHLNRSQGNKALIKKYHRLIKDRNEELKCQWCAKYQSVTWDQTHLDSIQIDSIGSNSKKLRIKGYINQSPVMTYVDSGADRNLITPKMVNLLGLPYAKKKQPTYVSSVATPNAETTINYETDHLPITIAGHTETIKFDIMPLGNCDVLLGHPWLKQGNPLINWRTEEILWETDVTPEL
jgi:hypothetical protein